MSVKYLMFLFFPVFAAAQWPSIPDRSGIGVDTQITWPGEAGPAGGTLPDPNAPLNLEIHHVIGDLSRDQQRSEAKPISGLVSLRQLQHRPSKKAVRAFQIAERYRQAGETGKSIDELEEAIRIDPSFEEAHQNLGVQYVRAGRIGEAMGQFETTLALAPADAKAYSNLGWCYARLKQLGEAGNFARKALALDPGNAPARTLLQFASSR